MSQPSYNPAYGNTAPPSYYPPQPAPYPQQHVGLEHYQQGPPPYQNPGQPYGYAAPPPGPYPQQPPPNTVIYREQPRTVYVYDNDRRQNNADASDCCLFALCAACLCCCLMDS